MEQRQLPKSDTSARWAAIEHEARKALKRVPQPERIRLRCGHYKFFRLRGNDARQERTRNWLKTQPCINCEYTLREEPTGRGTGPPGADGPRSVQQHEPGG